MTRKEQEELAMLQSNIKLDLKREWINMCYPVIEYIMGVKDKRWEGQAIMEKVEKQLLRQGKKNKFECE